SARWNQRRRQTQSPHDDRKGLRRPRCDRPGRTAGHLTGRSHCQRGSQCNWRARAAFAFDSGPSSGRFAEGRCYRMKSFEYAAPSTLKEATALLSDKWGETEILAGGTDLVTSLKQYLTTPSRIVSLRNISELKGIQTAGKAVRIGATTTLGELAGDKAGKEHFPALIAAAEFFQTPKTASERETALKPNEILAEIEIPLRGLKNATYEVRHRHGLDWPYATASVAFEIKGGMASNARVVLGQVAPVPWSAVGAAKILSGAK